MHEVLQTHLEAIRNGSAPLKYDIESWQDLERWFRTQLELQKRFRMTRGCPFGTIGNEVTENDELIRQDLCLIFEVVRNQLAAFFVEQKAKGTIAKSADVWGTCRFLHCNGAGRNAYGQDRAQQPTG